MAPTGLPAGILTCVFTDIEGSTRMLRTIGPVYEEIQARHDIVLREVWPAHDGHEVKTLGDGFMVVFQHATDAVRASVAAQRALAAVDWPTDLPVRVRIGMHTGYARPSGDDYTALVINRAARVIGAARGGQVLLTDETAAQVEAAGGCEDVALHPLGRFRVRDFDEPVALLAATGPGVPAIDAPPRVRPADGHNLVRPATSLIGRERDVARIAELVVPGRVTTIVGPGGVGKTRLATEAALRLAGDWEDGAWFVDLAPLGEDALVGEAIGDAVGAPGVPGAERWPEVLAHLEERRALVILDNCEHVTEASARAAAEIVSHCPGVAVLATSRNPLGLRGERAHRLAPLVTTPAVELFVDRSGLDDADRDVVAALCAELDGLPLAIELAAARAASVPPEEILRQVRRSPTAIAVRDPTLPERQRSLERLLDWSWDLLSAEERTVLGRLSVFAGSFDVEGAEAVCAGGGVGVDEVPELLWSLIDASLVRLEETAGATRYRLLTTVRAYAAGRTGEEERASATRRLASMLLERVGPERVTQPSWLPAIQLELDNVRHAAAADSAGAPTSFALTWAIGHLHAVTDHYAAGVTELRAALAARPERPPERVPLLSMLADLRLRTDGPSAAEAILAEAAQLAAEVGVPAWDDAGLARTRADLVLREGEPARAAQIAQRALEDVTSQRGRARLWSVLGVALAMSGDLEGSADAFREELVCATEAGLAPFLPTTHANLAETYLQLGAQRMAAHHQAIALRLAREQALPVIVAFSLMIAARLVGEHGEPRDAVILQTKADALLEAANYALYEEDDRLRVLLLANAAARLGPAAHADALRAAAALTDDQAADRAEQVLVSIEALQTTDQGRSR